MLDAMPATIERTNVAPEFELERMELDPLDVRAAIVPTSADKEKRTVEVVLSTGATVDRYNWRTEELYREQLSLETSAVRLDRLNSGAPLLDSHWGYSLAGQLGVIVPGTARLVDVDGKRELRAVVQFRETAEAEAVWRDVLNGTVRNLSIGYRVHRLTLVERVEGQPPLYRADDWEPYEGSFVPMPADYGAGVRSDHGGARAPTPNLCTVARATNRNHPSAMPTPTTTTTDLDNARAAGIAAERTRASAIRSLCTSASLPTEFAEDLIGRADANGSPTVDVGDARRLVLEEVLRRQQETEIAGSHRSTADVGEDDRTKLRAAIADGLALRGGISLGYDEAGQAIRAAPGANDFRGMRLTRIAALLLARQGLKTERMSERDLVDAILDGTRASAHGPSDFTSVVSNVATKSLRGGYQETPRTFTNWARPTEVPDFKSVKRVVLGTAPDLRRVKSNGEVFYGSFGDAEQAYAIASYARIFAVTRETLINDDLDAFTRVPQMFGAAGARLESDLVYLLLTAEQVLDETGLALFAGGHNNTGTGVISIDNINAGVAKMGAQTSPEGHVLSIIPAYLVVPLSRWSTAYQFTAALTPQQQSAVNPFGTGSPMALMPIAEARLDANSTAEWYLIARNSQVDTIEYATLMGQGSGVYLEQRVGFNIDGLEIKARHDFGASAIDYRGFYRSSGA